MAAQSQVNEDLRQLKQDMETLWKLTIMTRRQVSDGCLTEISCDELRRVP